MKHHATSTSSPAGLPVPQSLAATLLTRVFSFYVIIAVFVTLVQMAAEYFRAEENLKSDLILYQQTLASGLATAVWGVDKTQLESTLRGMLELPAIRGVTIMDELKENTIMRLGVGEDAAGGYVQITDHDSIKPLSPVGIFTLDFPLSYQNHGRTHHVGYITIYSDKAFVVNRVKTSFLFLICNSLVKSLALWLIFLRVANVRLAKPLSTLTQVAQRLKRGSFKVYDQLSPQELALREKDDEIGLLANAFFEMLRELKDAHDKLWDYNERLEEKVKDKVSMLEKSQEKLIQSEKMASLGKLVAGMAHEINTPLGIGLTSISELMDRNRKLGQSFASRSMTKADFERHLMKMDEICQMVMNNLQNTASLVASFKEVSADQASALKRTFNLKKYMEDVITSLTPELKKYKAQIKIDCPAGIELLTFPGPFAQVVTNLIMNSLIHGYDRAPNGQIDVHAAEENGRVLVRFKDYGKGIPKEHMGRVFDPFFTTRRGDGGTGLGLAIVYNIVQQNLEGEVSVHSTPGEGAEFLVAIPKKLIP